MNWLHWAVLSALFAGLTAILAKVGVQDINSNLATAIRTTVILVFAWGVALIGGATSDPVEDLAVPGAVRIGDRGILALLFPGPSARRGVARCAGGQAQRRSCYGAGLYLPG